MNQKFVRIISIKTRKKVYKVYRKEFKSRKHFENWYAVTESYGNKIIGIEDSI